MRETIVAIVAGLLVGLAVGVLGTVAHRSTVLIGTVSLPTGLVLALLAAGGVFLGLRLTLDRPLAAGAAALGAWIALAVLCLPSPGGSVLIRLDTVGYVWIFGVLALGVIALLFPMPRSGGADEARLDSEDRPELPEEP